MRRVPGQSPAFPGVLVIGDLAVTSGTVCPSVFTDRPRNAAGQMEGVLEVLDAGLRAAGSGLGHAVRVEAFLASANLFPEWDAQFAAIWPPTESPCRTTLVTAFAIPSVLVEVQLTATLAPPNPKSPIREGHLHDPRQRYNNA